MEERLGLWRKPGARFLCYFRLRGSPYFCYNLFCKSAGSAPGGRFISAVFWISDKSLRPRRSIRPGGICRLASAFEVF